MECCTAAVNLQEEGDFYNLQIVESELRERHWNWAGASLENYVRQQLSSIPKLKGTQVNINDLVDTAIPLVWQAVDKGKKARGSNQFNNKFIKALNPKTAVWLAIGSF